MLYLNKKMQFFDYELTSFKYQILKDIFINYQYYFQRHASSPLATEHVGMLRDKLKEKLDATNPDDTNWSPFTYKFSFLLGKKKYFRNVLPLENDIVNNYLSDKAREDFLKRIKVKIVSDHTLLDGMGSSNTSKIVDALDKIELMIANIYTEFQYNIFNPFDTRVNIRFSIAVLILLVN
jgi:hypothetical protein